MAQVNVTISGKSYRMACDDGQEAHLISLGERLNGIIDQLRLRFGEIGDQRLTVMAAITMADQFSEAERRAVQLEAEVANLEDGAGRRSSAGREDRRWGCQRHRDDGGAAGGHRPSPQRRRIRGKRQLARPPARAAVPHSHWHIRRAHFISRNGEAAGRDRRHASPGPYRS